MLLIAIDVVYEKNREDSLVTLLCLLSIFNSLCTEDFLLSGIKMYVLFFFLSLDCLAISLDINKEKNNILDKL